MNSWKHFVGQSPIAGCREEVCMAELRGDAVRPSQPPDGNLGPDGASIALKKDLGG